MRFRETPTEKQFLDSMKDERALNRKTVKAVLRAWRDFVEQKVMEGEAVYFSFGTLQLVENKYKSQAIIAHKGRGKRHEYRPRMKFNQGFCKKIGERRPTPQAPSR